MLVKLGMRASEVAALTLDDIDWRSGEMLIRTNDRARARMPIPPDVGLAVVASLRHGRPRSHSDIAECNQLGRPIVGRTDHIFGVVTGMAPASGLR
jgi:integrase